MQAGPVEVGTRRNGVATKGAVEGLWATSLDPGKTPGQY